MPIKIGQTKAAIALDRSFDVIPFLAIMRSILKKLARLIAKTCLKNGAIALTALASTLSAYEGVMAQVTPSQEGTTTNTEVITTPATGTTNEQINITGGQRSSNGANLFHSLEQFNIETGQTANFITVPEIQNVLGRINGGASTIDGLLQVLGSEANLYLINPAGILFGPNAQINLLGNFTATTATSIGFGDQWLNALSDYPAANYSELNGTPTTFDFATAGNIINLGDLTVDTGRSLSLMGGTVINTGNLSAPGGNITLTAVEAGNLIRIGQGEQLLSIEISPVDSGNGENLLTPLTLSELLTGSGIDYANALVTNVNGTVQLANLGTLIPENDGTVLASGVLSTASNTGIGGVINLFGSRVALLAGSLNASGHNGGGTLRLGGDYQGSGLAPTARQTYIGASSTIAADALNSGNGGQIYIWSNEDTQFNGHLSARGGELSGNGGFAEISGKNNLAYNGSVDLDAPQGNVGAVLFDPNNITIRAGAGTDTTPGFTLPAPTTLTINGADGTGDFILYEDTLATFSNITLQARNDITIQDPNLTFQPGSTVVFIANSQGMMGDFIMPAATDTLTAIGGSISIQGTGIQVGHINTGTTGSVTLTSDNINLQGGNNSIASGSVTLQPISTGLNLRLGPDTGAGNTWHVTPGAIDAIDSTQLTLGRTDGTGAITIDPTLANTIAAGNLNVTLRGAATNSLTSPDTNTIWNLTDQNTGTFGNYNNRLGFAGIGNIVGGAGDDTFNFTNPNAQITTSIDARTGNLTLRGNDMRLPTSLSSSGTLSIRPNSPTATIQLGGPDMGAAGVLNLETAEINGIQDGFTAIEIGSANHGPITLGDGVTFKDPVTLRSGTTINAQGNNLTGTGNASINILANGDIAASNITTTGQDITITSDTGTITTGVVQSQAPNPGGNIALTSPGNITTERIDARGNGTGGNIAVTTQGNFQATGSIPRGGNATSIETSDNATINIQHGGNGATPFVVGSATTNGSLGRITNDTNTIQPQQITGNLTDGNISITTQVAPTPATQPAAPATINPSGFIVPILDEADELSVVLSEPESPTAAEVFNQIETSVGSQFKDHLSLSSQSTQVTTLTQAQQTLQKVAQTRNIQSALVYVYFVPDASSEDAVSQTGDRIAQPTDQLEVMVIPPKGEPVRVRQWGITREQVEAVAADFRYQTTNQFSRPKQYLPPAQQLYSWMIAPLEETLKQQGINNLAFVIEEGLRTLPLSALHDGEQFLIERYSLGLLPTFSLTDFGDNTSDIGVGETMGAPQVLAMGASSFADQPPLPAVEAELSYISQDSQLGTAFLNEDFTLENLENQIRSEQYGVVHLATHAVFEANDYDNSYIQLWNDRLNLSQLSNLNLQETGIGLIILSACNTALGDPNSEYGFAGLAVNAGSQSALASLWPVSDEGTLGFMTQFYTQFGNASSRSESLRQAQIALLRGEIGIRNGQIYGPKDIDLAVIAELAESGSWDFSHPFYWSAFTMIGNPW